MNRRRLFISLALLSCIQGSVRAQDSTHGPATPATKLGGGGGAAGDPNGAIRALGSVEGGSGKQVVTVPHLGRQSPTRTGGEPAGTTGPAR